jgi:serine/threonine protein kinase/cytochrome c-type biogenesis protein CcmH/NrfG
MAAVLVPAVRRAPARQSEEAMPLEPGQTLSHYRLVEKVGEGGMGVVWKALDTSLGREVALKLLPDALAVDPARLARLESEAKTIAALNHPHIVTIYSIEEADARRFLTMEFVSGRTLSEIVPAQGLPFADLMRIALPVAEAVGAAHRRGVVHRDLKPRNIMVDAEGRVKVLDFGLAQSLPAPATEELSDRTTRTLAGHGLMGTLAYMSPEQLRAEATDPRTDVFSLGVLLYEMATGRRPFEAKSTVDLITAILRDTPVPPSRLRTGLPGRIDRLLARCLEKDPRYRLPSAVDLGWELEQLQAEAHREELRAVAVLPFVDLSREKDQEYLCDGLAEEILIALSKVGGLRVASRAASFRFRSRDADVRETGRRLGVEAIVHGSVRKSGERLRVAIELVNVADGFEMWAEVYDRGIEDVFAVQDEIARRVVRELGVSLSETEQKTLGKLVASDVRAFDYYLQARRFFYQYSRKSMRFARELFERAIALDPGYARAWSGIADCCAFLYLNAGRETSDLEQADAASRRALELDPGSAEAHASRGAALSLRGLHDEAERAFEAAIRLAPDLFEAHYFYARDAFMSGQPEKAIGQYEESMRARPEDYQAPLLVGQIFEDLGRTAEAQAVRRRGVRIAEEQLRLQPDDVRALYMGANGLVALGETKRGLEWVDRALALEPEDAMVLYNIACIKAMAGAEDEALDCLERSVRGGLRNRAWLEHDSNLDSLRSRPRFQTLLQGL